MKPPHTKLVAFLLNLSQFALESIQRPFQVLCLTFPISQSLIEVNILLLSLRTSLLYLPLYSVSFIDLCE